MNSQPENDPPVCSSDMVLTHQSAARNGREAENQSRHPFMENNEYQATLDLLLQSGRMVDMLDLNGFRDRIRHAHSIGSVLDPTLYRDAHRNLQDIDELASAAIRLKVVFQTLKNRVALELERVTEDT